MGVLVKPIGEQVYMLRIACFIVSVLGLVMVFDFVVIVSSASKSKHSSEHSIFPNSNYVRDGFADQPVPGSE